MGDGRDFVCIIIPINHWIMQDKNSLDWSWLKWFAGDKIKVTEKKKEICFREIEDIFWEKEKMLVSDQQLLLVPLFSTLSKANSFI